MPANRSNSIRVAVNTSFILLLLWLFWFQVVRYSYYHDLSRRNSIRLIPTEGQRGIIYDRNKTPVAIDTISFNLALIPQDIKDLHSTMKGLSRITGVDDELLLKNYRRNFSYPFAPVKIISDLERDKAFSIEEQLYSVPGAFIWSVPKRHYPGGESGCHMLGYLGKIGKDELEGLEEYGYTAHDLVGKSGVERYYDSLLKGEDGGMQVQVDALSRQVKRLGFKEPRKGKDITLTIDAGLESFVCSLLKEKSGACVIMEVDTGEVLAIASSPSFDPNIFTGSDDREKISILNNSAKPMLNRAIGCAYPPGSTFKIIVAACGLSADMIKRHTSFVCNGSFNLGRRVFKCWKEEGHGSQDLMQALAHSCNVFFYNAGRIIGAEKIAHYASVFGLGSATGIDLPGETRGLVPSPVWKKFFLNEPWYEGDTVNYSIGQGYLLSTPIQMLRAVTIIANSGLCPLPHLLKEIDSRPVLKRRIYKVKLKESVFKIIKAGMHDVVNSPTGTGQNAKSQYISVSGKTGTAQAGTGVSHAWFVGYMPSEKPRYSIVVFLEHGGMGGLEPAHMTRLITTYLKENGFFKDGDIQKT